uniref:Fibroblast growth factor (acidic) intracellular binding protein b n=1 Tax=Sinocyclocheilus rhinocerous TaxID=307959 RepID=A0A673I908_9TELE
MYFCTFCVSIFVLVTTLAMSMVIVVQIGLNQKLDPDDCEEFDSFAHITVSVSVLFVVLMHKARKEISSATAIPCVFKVVEELKGPLVENTQRHFLLSDVLTRDYAAIVFFANSRFETGKRKLQYLSFQDFAFCAGQLSSYWTVGAVDNVMEDMDVDLEKEFLHDLKDLNLVCMEASFKNLSRALVNIASKLTHTKDVRDLFIELVVKFIEPCRSDKWTIGDLRLFLTHYSSSVHTLEAFRHQVVWDRYIGVIKSCILKMYHD